MWHLDIMNQMTSRCPEVPTRMLNAGRVYMPEVLRAVVLHLDGIVSGLMHFLIIGAGAGTPVHSYILT